MSILRNLASCWGWCKMMSAMIFHFGECCLSEIEKEVWSPSVVVKWDDTLVSVIQHSFGEIQCSLNPPKLSKLAIFKCFSAIWFLKNRRKIRRTRSVKVEVHSTHLLYLQINSYSCLTTKTISIYGSIRLKANIILQILLVNSKKYPCVIEGKGKN